MKIGIDIDDTITNSWIYYLPIYSKVFDIPIEKLTLSKPYQEAIKDKYTKEQFNDMLRPINDKYAINIPLKENVKEIIDKLYELGHSVIFITARTKDYTNPYQMTKDYLNKHQIKYDKIIVNASEKDKVCLNENIDLFIDDNIRNCTIVTKTGIEVIMFDAPHNQSAKEFKHLKSWKEIYEYIKSR